MKRPGSLVTAVILTLTVIFSGCGSEEPVEEQPQIKATDMVMSIGAVSEDRTDEQRLSYKITLHNESAIPVRIKSIEPVLVDAMTERVLDDDLEVTVDRIINANGYLMVEGEFHFDATDLTKQDITAMEPIIYNVWISATSIIISLE